MAKPLLALASFAFFLRSEAPWHTTSIGYKRTIILDFIVKPTLVVGITGLYRYGVSTGVSTLNVAVTIASSEADGSHNEEQAEGEHARFFDE